MLDGVGKVFYVEHFCARGEAKLFYVEHFEGFTKQTSVKWICRNLPGISTSGCSQICCFVLALSSEDAESWNAAVGHYFHESPNSFR